MPKNNPHNALFVKTFSIRSEAKAFVQQFLPKWISESIDYRSFKQDNTSYITDELKEYFSDIVYEAKWNNKEAGIKISFLLEHKSFVPTNIFIQLNKYLTEGYQKQYTDKKNKKLTIIIPVIIYHGKQKWHQRTFPEYFDLPDELLIRYIPSYMYELVDLNKIPDEWIFKLSFGHFLKSAFLVFKHQHDKKFLHQFQQKIFIFVDKEPDKERVRLFFISLLTYIFSVFQFSEKEANEYFKKLNIPDMVDYVKGSLYDQWVTEGIEKGLEQGIEKGLERGLEKGMKKGLEQGKAIILEKTNIEKGLSQAELLLDLYQLKSILGMSKVVQLSKIKKETIEKFYKVIPTENLEKIEQVAKTLFFKKIKPASKFEKQLRKVVATYLKKVKK